MTENMEAEPAALAWRQQSVWSQSANQLKRSIGIARTVSLSMTVLGALLATGAAQASSWNQNLTKGLALGAAVAVALGPIAGRFTTHDRTRDWTRLRSVSESVKANVYTYLAGVSPFDGPGKDQELLLRLTELQNYVEDLRKYTAGISPVNRGLPPVSDVPTYITERLVSQLNGYYRPNAKKMRDRVTRVQRAEIGLSLIAAILAALASVYGKDSTAAWVAAVTTIIAAVTAHGAASRYEYQEIEYERTGDELERLRSRFSIGEITDIISESERIISIQNEGWMAKLSSPEP